MTQSSLCFIVLIFSSLFYDGLTSSENQMKRKHSHRNPQRMIDDNQNMENKKSSEKLSNMIQEIESVVKEKEERSSPLVVQDKIDEESQDESEENKDGEQQHFQGDKQHLHPDTIIKDIEESMKPVLQGM